MITYSVYTVDHADELVRLLSEVFVHGDPPAMAVDLTASEFQSFVKLLCPRAATDGLTIIARDAATGEMVGALLSEDASAPAPQGMDQLSPKFAPIFDILDELVAEYRANRPPPSGECAHLFLLGVSARHTGRGIARQLIATCLAQAVAKGYRVAVTEATNTTSQHVFARHGFEERVRRSYQQHRFNGRSYFASIADQGGPMLMERRLP